MSQITATSGDGSRAYRLAASDLGPDNCDRKEAGGAGVVSRYKRYHRDRLLVEQPGAAAWARAAVVPRMRISLSATMILSTNSLR